jgi:hypothetical protein
MLRRVLLALLVAPVPGDAAPTPARGARICERLGRADLDPSRCRTAGLLDRPAGAAAELDRRIPALQPHEVILGMARIVALVGDGHTRLGLPLGSGWEFDYAHTPTPAPRDSTIRFHHLPVRYRWYDDGLAIDAVRPGLEDLLGARVQRIEGWSADSAMARVRPFVSVDNDLGWRLLGPARLACVEALHALGIASVSTRSRSSWRPAMVARSAGRCRPSRRSGRPGGARSRRSEARRDWPTVIPTGPGGSRPSPGTTRCSSR